MLNHTKRAGEGEKRRGFATQSNEILSCVILNLKFTVVSNTNYFAEFDQDIAILHEKRVSAECKDQSLAELNLNAQANSHTVSISISR